MHAFSKAPLLHGRYPLPRYYGPLRHPLGRLRLWIPAPRWLFASQEGFPGSSADLSTRAAPNHPGRPGECLPVTSPPVSGFIPVGGLATSIFLSRPNRVHLRCGSRVRPYPVRQIDFSTPRWLGYMSEQAIYMVNSFQFTRSARLILAYRPSGTGPSAWAQLSRNQLSELSW